MSRYSRKTIKRPSEPPKSAHCPACLLTLDYLRQRADVYECSRVECPTRKGCTAQPGDKARTHEVGL